MPEEVEKEKNDSALVTSPCPGCGTEMVFDPESRKLKCPSCGNTAEIPGAGQSGVTESDYLSVLNNLSENAETAESLTVTCPNCAAEVALPPNVIADKCAYCGTPLIASQHSTRQIKPSALLPFSIDAEKAGQLYTQWLSSRWFLPNAVKKEFKTLPLKGCYLPFWLYDCDTDTAYSGMRGIYYYVTVTYTERDSNGRTVTKTRQERRTRWYYISGRVRNCFADVLVPASHGASRDLLDELEPWDLKALTPCHDDYLKGFQAEAYATTLADGFQFAREKMTPSIESTIRRDIGGDEQQIWNYSVTYDDIKFKHVLLPVHLSAMRYRSKAYQFVINARTGEVQGERPYSVIKIILLILFIAAVIVGIYFAMAK